MATRGTIALEYADGTVGQIYSHWDNYLEHNGAILLKHYQDPAKVKQLIDLGDLSTLRAEIGQQHDFDDSLIEDWCKFYGRDRRETNTMARRFVDFNDYLENHQYEEYEYILRLDGQWYVYGPTNQYVPLAEVLAEQLYHDHNNS